MRDNNYRAVEGILYNLPKLRVEIENLKLRIEDAQEVIGITGASGNEKAGSSTNAFSSVVENEVLERERTLEKMINIMKKELNRKEREIKRVENVLNLLSEREMLIVELRYFKRYSVNRICEILDLTTPTFNRRRKEIVAGKLMPILIYK